MNKNFLIGDREEMVVGFKSAEEVAQFHKDRGGKTSSAIFAKLKVQYAFEAGAVKGKIIATDGSGKEPQILTEAEGKSIHEVSEQLLSNINGTKLKPYNQA